MQKHDHKSCKHHVNLCSNSCTQNQRTTNIISNSFLCFEHLDCIKQLHINFEKGYVHFAAY